MKKYIGCPSYCPQYKWKLGRWGGGRKAQFSSSSIYVIMKAHTALSDRLLGAWASF